MSSPSYSPVSMRSESAASEAEVVTFQRRYAPSIRSIDSMGNLRNGHIRATSRNRSKNTLEVAEEKSYNFPAQFTSRRLQGPIEKPWKRKNSSRAQIIIPAIGMLVGVLLGAYMIYRGYQSVPRHKFCQVFDEDWTQGIRESVWNREVQVGGFGNGQFEWTTANDRNAYIDKGVLRIVPTLTNAVLTDADISNGYTLNLTSDGTCSSSQVRDCVVVSNSTKPPFPIINPVQSARLTTAGKFSMKYGKIEIRAKLPKGDWLWPAIWMMPENSIYGDWPRSGEIDIVESRGNDRSYPQQNGRNKVSSSLHWGPAFGLDSFYKTTNYQTKQHVDYTETFNTFGLEWTDEYIYTYVNNHLAQILNVKFNKPFFKRGKYPSVDAFNKTAIDNPWGLGNIAPFDQDFFLILNVAVGGTNGFFPEGQGNKPWSNESPSAMLDFWNARASWYPTWGATDVERGMSIESIKAWKLCD